MRAPECVSLVLQIDSVVFGDLVCEVRQQGDLQWSQSSLFPGCVNPDVRAHSEEQLLEIFSAK